MKTAIVIAFDKAYYEYAPILIKSLAQNYNGLVKLNIICIVTSEILNLSEDFSNIVDEKEKLNIEFRVSEGFEKLITGREIMAEGRAAPWLNKGCYLRIFVGSVCHDFDKAIYLDVDMMAFRDIQPVLDFPQHRPFIALYDSGTMPLRSFDNQELSYFNDGRFSVDLNWWRDNSLENKMVDWINNNEPMYHVEQDVMNMFLRDIFYPLPDTMNFYRWRVDPLTVQEGEARDYNPEPLLVHYLGPCKPWNQEIYGPGEARWFNAWFDLYKQIYKKDIRERWSN